MNRFICLAAAAALLAVGTAARSQTAFAERSEVIGTGQDVHLYGLSTKDSNGKIRCYDVTATLTIGDTGKPANSAAVTSVACPKVTPGDFASGTYDNDAKTEPCTLVASPYGGRTEYDLFCKTLSDNRQYTYTWYSGAISGSPIEAQLTQAGLNTLPGNDQYAWGRITRTDYGLGCTTFGALFGAREVAGHLELSIYGFDSTLDCTAEFIKQTP